MSHNHGWNIVSNMVSNIVSVSSVQKTCFSSLSLIFTILLQPVIKKPKATINASSNPPLKRHAAFSFFKYNYSNARMKIHFSTSFFCNVNMASYPLPPPFFSLLVSHYNNQNFKKSIQQWRINGRVIPWTLYVRSGLDNFPLFPFRAASAANCAFLFCEELFNKKSHKLQILFPRNKKKLNLILM
jgi:hypothetical protein